jgi:hypothetical protein
MWVGFVFIYVTAVAVLSDEGQSVENRWLMLTAIIEMDTRGTLWSVTLQRVYSLMFYGFKLIIFTKKTNKTQNALYGRRLIILLNEEIDKKL